MSKEDTRPTPKQKRCLTAKLVDLPDSLNLVKHSSLKSTKGEIRRAKLCLDSLQNSAQAYSGIQETQMDSSLESDDNQEGRSCLQRAPSAFNIVGRGRMPAIMFVNGKIVVCNEKF